ncbi:hypothetical protein C5167_027695 [Papaver somniferum]|nr:hypothetical protein C5167_027695 [Papaver somniferum]
MDLEMETSPTYFDPEGLCTGKKFRGFGQEKGIWFLRTKRVDLMGQDFLMKFNKKLRKEEEGIKRRLGRLMPFPDLCCVLWRHGMTSFHTT